MARVNRLKIAAGPLFSNALKQINRETSNIKLLGRRRYYNLNDAKGVWKRQFGQCYDCGLPLNARGNLSDSGKFTHRVPVKLGGKVHRDNLILVCPFHKKDRDKRRIPPSLKIIGYNAFSDLVVQLINAVISKDELKINYFKQSLDFTLKDIVDSSYYEPVGKIEMTEVAKSTISSHIELLTKELAKEISIVGQTKTTQVK